VVLDIIQQWVSTAGSLRTLVWAGEKLRFARAGINIRLSLVRGWSKWSDSKLE
jgi:hypothetical protein